MRLYLESFDGGVKKGVRKSHSLYEFINFRKQIFWVRRCVFVGCSTERSYKSIIVCNKRFLFEVKSPRKGKTTIQKPNNATSSSSMQRVQPESVSTPPANTTNTPAETETSGMVPAGIKNTFSAQNMSQSQGSLNVGGLLHGVSEWGVGLGFTGAGVGAVVASTGVALAVTGAAVPPLIPVGMAMMGTGVLGGVASMFLFYGTLEHK
ncbi:MAG: hypothetical protein AAGJ35_03670 [Myxococcota bacterium]